MSIETAYVILTPYTLRKQRAGAILSRLLSALEAELAAARVMLPDAAFVERLAALSEPEESAYIRRHLAAVGGKAPRILVWLLRGEDAVARVAAAVGAVTDYPAPGRGATIRDSFADRVSGYFEPGVLVAAAGDSARTVQVLAELAALADRQDNLVTEAVDVTPGEERTLVMLKPENWRRPSLRPGAILDLFTRTGLVLAGCKMHHIALGDALEFYGQVQGALREKLAPKMAAKAAAKLEEAFGLTLSAAALKGLEDGFGRDFADDQFYSIVRFMSGVDPLTCPPEQRKRPGQATVMVLVFSGADAVAKVRRVLGPTDPAKAPGGTVRGEFGTDVMVNAAHASDSVESFQREAGILRVTENDFALVARS